MEIQKIHIDDLINSLDNLANLEDDTITIRRTLNHVLYDEEEAEINEEGEWRLSYLKQQYESLEIQSLFKRYLDRINHGYFSLFLILQIPLGLIHFGILWYVNKEHPNEVLPDLILYAMMGILPIIGLLLTDSYIKNNLSILKYMSILSFLMVFVTDGFIPYYYLYRTQEHFRPAYTTHLLLSSYIFFHIQDNLVAIMLGLFVSIFHVSTLIRVTYTDSSIKIQRVLTDVIFLFCLNALGVYFRYMNEIVKRKSFLDTRACVESNFQLNHEKQQEEQLLSSIIPGYIIEKVKEKVDANHLSILQPKSYQGFTGRHDNVTILFADIVNYTEMTSKLDIKQLIKTLNELFGRFDDASEELKVLRIKFLGDCYYCVAGLPPYVNGNHAEACVDLGLRMISIIADIRAKRNLNINMRIGIHSGSIIGGIIGKSKWQYDIWSNDVDIANKMETEGEPGKVHITKQTKDLLNKTYAMVPTNKGSTVPQFIQNDIETFLITPDPTTFAEQNDVKNRENGTYNGDIPSNRRTTLYKKRGSIITYAEQQYSSGPVNYPRRSITFKRNPVTTYIGSQFERGSIAKDATHNSDDKRDTYFSRRSTLGNRKRNTLHDDDHACTPNPVESMKKPSPAITFIEQQNKIDKSSRDLESNDSRQNIALKSSFIESQLEREYVARQTDCNEDDPSRRRDTYRRSTMSRRSESEESKRRTAFMNNNIKRYEERLHNINETMKKAIDNMSLSKYQQWFKSKSINPFLIMFKSIRSEMGFMHLPDHLFKYYILAELPVIICMFLIKNITLTRWQWSSWTLYAMIILIVFVFLPFTWTHHLWCRKFSSYQVDAPRNPILKFLYYKSEFITNNVYARTSIYTVICVLFTIYIFTDLQDCREYSSDGTVKRIFPRISTLTLLKQVENENPTIKCIFPWHMSQACLLAIIVSFLFLRIHLWIKFLYASVISLAYVYIIWNFDEFYQESETFNPLLSPKIAHVISILFLTFTLHLVDRQTNYMYRLDYMWNEQLITEQKKANKIRLVNLALLINILPLHVAKIYLNVKRQPSNEFYHEYYNDVAVLFASIIDYPTITKEEQIDYKDMGVDPELNILTAMNKIFIDFDELTTGNKFGRPIEKIKITKWTYMAACGLAPGLGETQNLRNDPMSHVVITLLRLASEMMKVVPGFNSATGQECKLRIGISYGKVVAGVVGSKKPLYDIWGDTVNMASRMDTTGLPNKIQVLEETANIIKEYGYECIYRGEIPVKGKEALQRTYFVGLEDDFSLKIKQDS